MRTNKSNGLSLDKSSRMKITMSHEFVGHFGILIYTRTAVLPYEGSSASLGSTSDRFQVNPVEKASLYISGGLTSQKNNGKGVRFI